MTLSKMWHWLNGIARSADSKDIAFYIVAKRLMDLSSAVAWRMDHMLTEAMAREKMVGG